MRHSSRKWNIPVRRFLLWHTRWHWAPEIRLRVLPAADCVGLGADRLQEYRRHHRQACGVDGERDPEPRPGGFGVEIGRCDVRGCCAEQQADAESNCATLRGQHEWMGGKGRLFDYIRLGSVAVASSAFHAGSRQESRPASQRLLRSFQFPEQILPDASDVQHRRKCIHLAANNELQPSDSHRLWNNFEIFWRKIRSCCEWRSDFCFWQLVPGSEDDQHPHPGMDRPPFWPISGPEVGLGLRQDRQTAMETWTNPFEHLEPLLRRSHAGTRIRSSYLDYDPTLSPADVRQYVADALVRQIRQWILQ